MIDCKDEDISEKFYRLLDSLDDEQWWKWVSGWLSTEFVADIYTNWDVEVMEDEIKVLEKMIDGKND